MFNSQPHLLDANFSDALTASMTQSIRPFFDGLSRIAFLIGALLLSAAFAAPSSVAQDVPVVTEDEVDPALEAGDTFTKEIRVNSLNEAEDINSVDVTLDVGGAPVEFVLNEDTNEDEPGLPFNTDGTLLEGFLTDTGTEGTQAEISAASQDALGGGADSGVLVEVELRVTSSGSGTVTFPEVQFNDQNAPGANLSQAGFDVVTTDTFVRIEGASTETGSASTVELSASDLSGFNITNFDIEVAVEDPVELNSDNPVNVVADIESVNAGYDASTDVLSISGLDQDGLSGGGVLCEFNAESVDSETTASLSFDDSGTEFRDDAGDAAGIATIDGQLQVLANGAPQATDDSYQTGENEVREVTDPANGVLGNDTDPDEDPLSVSLVDDVDNGVLSFNDDGTFTFDPDGQFEGLDDGETAEETFTYEAADELGGTDQATVTVTINGENDPPVVSGLADADTTIDEDTSTEPIGFSVEDPETAPENLTVTATSGNPDLVPDDSIEVTGPDAQGEGSLTVEPTADSNGTADITVTAENGGELTDSQTFTLEVEPVNDGPFFTSVPPDTTAAVEEELALQLEASPGPGETGDQVTFSLVDPPADSSDDGTATIDPDTGELTFIPLLEQADSTLEITAQIEDSEGLTATDSFEVSVEIDVLLGDITGDGDVSAFDANRTLRAAVNLSPPRPLSTRDSIAADVSGNGGISGQDASLILQFVVGIIDTFPAAEDEESSSAAASNATAEAGAKLAWGEARTADGQTVLPIRVGGSAQSVQSMDITVSGDISAIETDRVESALPDGWMVAQGERQGELRIAMASARPLQETGEVVRLPIDGEKQDLSLSAEGTVAGAPATLGEAPIASAAESFKLVGSYPNPVRSQMTISLNLPEDAKVGIEMYDVLGRQVATFSEKEVTAGQEKTLQLDASGLSSGSYFYRVRAEAASQEWTDTGRVTVVR